MIWAVCFWVDFSGLRTDHLEVMEFFGGLLGSILVRAPLAWPFIFLFVKTYHTVSCVIRPVATFASFFVEIRRSTVSLGRVSIYL